ncbi:MAG TPA: PEP/pyruvate-binding domain-containing protein [Niastella sp.]
MESFIIKFKDISINDVAKVGGKNASLGEMFNKLSAEKVAIPDGFAITADAFWFFIDRNRLRDKLNELLATLDTQDFSNLGYIGKQARSLILGNTLPHELQTAIVQAYNTLCGDNAGEVAVRSSATAEDLPQASFAGQHESYLNVSGVEELLTAVQKCFASLYTDRAIKYREDNKFEHAKVALSVGVQKMVRSDKACAGVCFTLEPESGFRDIIHLSGVWGLGENIVQGAVTPDEFFVFKPSLKKGEESHCTKKIR